MAIEIEKKSKLKGPLWLYILMVVGVVLALGLAGTYFYFFKVGKDISQQIEEMDQALKKTSEEKELENTLLSKEKKVEDFQELLSKHRKVLNVFNFFQEKTHPKTWFSEFDFSGKEKTVSLSGTADGFIAVGQQILILREEELLKNIKLSGLSMGEEGKIEFSLQLTLDPQIFK